MHCCYIPGLSGKLCDLTVASTQYVKRKKKKCLFKLKTFDITMSTYIKKGGRQGTNGFCVVTKTNAWKTVRCESVERRKGGKVWKLG